MRRGLYPSFQCPTGYYWFFAILIQMEKGQKQNYLWNRLSDCGPHIKEKWYERILKYYEPEEGNCIYSAHGWKYFEATGGLNRNSEAEKLLRACIQKFPDWVITKSTINTRWEAMAVKLTRLTHKIAIQLYLVAESCTICSFRSRLPVRKILDTPSYICIYHSHWLNTRHKINPW
jgi:hypothetical protein